MFIYKSLNTNHKNVFTETNICKKNEMINSLCSEIRLFFLDFVDNHNDIALTLFVPIKIDDIKLYICIRKNNAKKYTYMLETVNVKMFTSNNNRARIIIFTSENYFEDLIELFNEINTIKDTYVFFAYNLISPKKYELYCRDSILNPEICPHCCKKPQLCSVCFEKTCVYTVCKHPLCFKCRDACVERKMMNCPVCRRKDVDMIYTKSTKIDYQYDDMEMVDLDNLIEDTLTEEPNLIEDTLIEDTPTLIEHNLIEHTLVEDTPTLIEHNLIEDTLIEEHNLTKDTPFHKTVYYVLFLFIFCILLYNLPINESKNA